MTAQTPTRSRIPLFRSLALLVAVAVVAILLVDAFDDDSLGDAIRDVGDEIQDVGDEVIDKIK
jgi:hypothetical protein